MFCRELFTASSFAELRKGPGKDQFVRMGRLRFLCTQVVQRESAELI